MLKKHEKATKSTTNLRFINLKFIDVRFINLKFIDIRFVSLKLIKLKKHLSGNNYVIRLFAIKSIYHENVGFTKLIKVPYQ